MFNNDVAKQVFEFQKDLVNKAFDGLELFQEQAEKITDTWYQQGAWIPEEGKRYYEQWTAASKAGRKAWKKAVDDQLKAAETYFATRGEAQ